MKNHKVYNHGIGPLANSSYQVELSLILFGPLSRLTTGRERGVLAGPSQVHATLGGELGLPSSVVAGPGRWETILENLPRQAPGLGSFVPYNLCLSPSLW